LSKDYFRKAGVFTLASYEGYEAYEVYEALINLLSSLKG
jgi:hypothetical protein